MDKVVFLDLQEILGQRDPRDLLGLLVDQVCQDLVQLVRLDL